MSTAFLLSYAVLWVLVVFQSLVLVGLVRTIDRVQRTAAGGLDVRSLEGREAPAFVAEDLSGAEVSNTTFEGTLRGFVFVSPDCRSCSLTLAELEAIEWKAEGTVIVVCRAGTEACRQLAQTYKLDAPVLVDESDEVGSAFGITALPAAVLVGADDRVKAYGQPMRGEELEDIFRASETDELVEAK